MNAVFADTSLLVAFISEKDEFHAAAVEFIRGFEGQIVTTDWVLLELGNYLAKTTHRSSFLPFLRQLKGDGRFRIVTATHDLFTEGIELYDQRPPNERDTAGRNRRILVGRIIDGRIIQLGEIDNAPATKASVGSVFFCSRWVREIKKNTNLR